MRSCKPSSLCLCVVGLLAACSSNGSKNDVGAEDVVLPEAGLPDVGELHPCTNPGGSCNAHNACAIDPICGPDKMCHPSKMQNCDDDLPCTQDICKGQGLCDNVPAKGVCALPVKLPGTVDGGVGKTELQCFKDGDRNPTDKCLVCRAGGSDAGVAADPLHWSLANGGPCDDGNACTKDDYCQAGMCKGEDFGKQCADTYSCTEDLCDGKGGCLGNKLRADYCLINGECYKDGSQDAGGCNICDVKTSQNKWTPLTVHCMIGGVCYKPGTKDPTGCGTCDPTKNDKDWTPLPGLCKIDNQCHTAAQKHPQGCAECDPPTSTTTWTVKGQDCLISDTCYKPAAKDPTGCATCDPAKSKTAWTPLTDQCLISGKCYAKGAKDTTGCGECDPTISTTAWAIKGATCLIGTTCYQPGQLDTTGCGSCDPTKSKTAWSAVSGKCLIGAQCYANGAKDGTGCLTCDFAKNPSGWTPLAGATTVGYTFEDGKSPPTGWTIANTDTKVGWVVSNKRPAAGSYSLYYGDPAAGNYEGSGTNSGTATMPPILITAGKKAGLSFMLWMDTESSTSYDTLEVYVGTKLVWEKDGTPPAGSTVTKKAWQEVNIDLGSYAGQTITIQFKFDTSDSISNDTEGTYIDNITIFHNC